jgi:hypothetical protein
MSAYLLMKNTILKSYKLYIVTYIVQGDQNGYM